MPLSFEELKDKLYKVLDEQYGFGRRSMWIVETYADAVIVERDEDGKIYKIGYEVDENGEVVITGEPVEMRKVYVEVEQPTVSMAKTSDYPAWGSVDKSSLPKEAYLIVGDPEKKSTWRFPFKYYRNGKLVVHPGGVLAAWQYRRHIKDSSKLAYLRSLYEKYWGKSKGKK